MIKKNKEFIKSIGIILIYESFAYFLIKLFINNYNIILPQIKFPLIKEFAIIYNSWYPFIFLIAFLLYKKDKENYKKFTYVMIIGILLSELTFILYPTMVIRPEIEIKSFSDLILYITYKCDTPAINCLPSVHCLFCFISIYYILITKNIKPIIKLPIISYLILIILSTLFIKQHILIDAIFAFIYTIISIIILKIFENQLKKILKFIF